MEIKSVKTSKGERFPTLVKEDGTDKPLYVRLYTPKEFELIKEKGPTNGITILGGFPYEFIRDGKVPEESYTATELLAKIIENPDAEEILKNMLYGNN